MAYFSRLTDIVTCSLTRLLEEADDPQVALQEIITEMETGLAGARRSMKTAKANEDRIRNDVDEHKSKISHWDSQAREALQGGAEDQARLALVRKREAEDLVAGLEEELRASRDTCEHLTRTYRALEARLAEARRREISVDGRTPDGEPEAESQPVSEVSETVASEIEDELAALKREMGQS